MSDRCGLCGAPDDVPHREGCAAILPPGWLSPADVAELTRLAAGRTVLELGAWKGRSTVALARVARYVVSVDRHRGIEGHDADSLPEYLENVRGLPNVAIVVADWLDLNRFLGRFDVVFVDGDHDRASVARDAQLALERDPDVIAFHDWDAEDVREGAADVLGAAGPSGLSGSVASFARGDWS